MMSYRPEAELTQPVLRYFQKKGFHWQATELQFYEYSIDIYGFSKSADKTVSVELKIKDWKRAFEQTLIYQLCSDLVIMAIPKETIHRVERAILQREGIGLLCVWPNNRCRIILQPRPSHVLSDSYKRRNINILQENKERTNGHC